MIKSLKSLIFLRNIGQVLRTLGLQSSEDITVWGSNGKFECSDVLILIGSNFERTGPQLKLWFQPFDIQTSKIVIKDKPAKECEVQQILSKFDRDYPELAKYKLPFSNQIVSCNVNNYSYKTTDDYCYWVPIKPPTITAKLRLFEYLVLQIIHKSINTNIYPYLWIQQPQIIIRLLMTNKRNSHSITIQQCALLIII